MDLEPESDDTQAPANDAGGLGGRSARGDDGLTGIHSARLNSLAVIKGWPPKGPRWAMDMTPEQIVEMAGERPLTIRERITVSVGTDAMSIDPRIRGIACKSGITMEAQNQKDELAAAEQANPKQAGNTTVNVGVAVHNDRDIAIVRRRDFYGNDAHDRETATDPAGAIEAPVESAPIPGPLQNADLRPKVGQNGNGSNGHAGGPRNGAGGLNGSH